MTMGSGGAEVDGVAVDALSCVHFKGIAADPEVSVLGGDIVKG